MEAKIFYRERTKVAKGAKTPRFRVVGMSNSKLKIYSNHLRKKELKQLARETGSVLVKLERDKNSKKK